MSKGLKFVLLPDKNKVDVDQKTEMREIQKQKDERILKKKENKKIVFEKGIEEKEKGEEEEEEEEEDVEEEEEEEDDEDVDKENNDNKRKDGDERSRSTLELSGGQLALLGLSFVFAAALHKRNPLYLLDEVSCC